ncbi:MAG: ABC transporter permease [Trueperaceae bacterium]
MSSQAGRSRSGSRNPLGAFLRKDVLIQVRDLKELALMLLMPIILIAILGLALGQFVTGGPVQLDIGAALVVEDDPTAGREEFTRRLAQTEMPLPQRVALTAAALTIQPQEMINALLSSPELADLIAVQDLDAEEAQALLEADDVQAVITLPSGFTGEMLSAMLLEGDGATMDVALSDASPLRAGIVNDILTAFAREVSFQSALSQELQAPPPGVITETGTVEELTVGARVPSTAFYTFGMATMFALFVAGSISGRAYLERAQLTFDRILLSGARPLAFLLSKAMAGAVIVFLQVAFLFVAATLILGALRGQPVSFWLGSAGIAAALALAVGAFSALVTSLNFRANNQAMSNVFNSVGVTLLAVLGGSFFPVEESSSLISVLGGWTPNGAALNGFLDAAKGFGLEAYGPDIIRILVGAVVLMVAAVALFPRKAVG